MALTRSDAHRLVDEIDPADVPTAVAVLRQLAIGPPRRAFRGFDVFDVFDGDEDLAERSSEILRAELGAEATSYGQDDDARPA